MSTTSAITSRMWMSAPAVGSATTPSSQRTRRTRTMVHSIARTSFFGRVSRKVRAMGDAAVARSRPRTLMRVRLFKSPRRALGLLIAAGLLFLLAVDISIRAEIFGHLYPDAERAPSAPLALILGAEVYADGRPSPALANRLDIGIELLRLGRVRALLMSGGNGTFEIGAMRAYA